MKKFLVELMNRLPYFITQFIDRSVVSRRILGTSVSAGGLGGAVSLPKQVQGRALVGAKGIKSP